MPPEDNGGYDIGAMAESIGNDIFGNDNPGTGANPPADPPAVASASATAPVPPNPTPENDPWAAMPKAWKKEKEPLWSKLDREAREYIHARETDVVKGFDQYATGHKSWSELTSPFQDVLQKHPNVNPIQLMQTLMRNHLGILSASPEQKRAIAQNLLKSYGIDLGTGAPAPAPLPPEVQAAMNEAREAKAYIERLESDRQREALANNERLVHEFAAKPENKYFEELGDDIIHLLKTGAAPSLEKAYEQACWTNPAVRAKILAEQAAGAKPPAKKPLNVNGTGGTPSEKPKTAEDTMNGIMEKHYGPNWKSLN